MKIAELFEEADYTSYDMMPDDASPYKSKNQVGVLPLSPYTNDMGVVPGFKDVDALVPAIDKRIERNEYWVRDVPTQKLLATQYWIDDSGYGMGDEVFPNFHKHPVIAITGDGFYHVIDGHHRATRAAEAGHPSIKAYVFDLRS